MIKKISVIILLNFLFLYGGSNDLTTGRIENLLFKIPSTTRIGILVYKPLTQDTIFMRNPELSMIPASNTKLFTTAAALSLLGGDFSLSTKLFSDDKNLKDGVLNGNLYLKGYGNSLFTEDDLRKMAAELSAKGVQKIEGNIVGDDTYFDDIYVRDDWIKDEVANVKLPPISALVLDRNRTSYTKKRRGRLLTYYGYVKDPPLHAAQKLKEMLSNLGVESKAAVKGTTPGSAVEITESAVLLRDLIAEINKHSDNFLAECLFKTIGAEVSGTQGNSFYSTQAVLDFIADNGIFAKGTAVVDGSGISRFNQITPGAITGVLEKMYFDLANFEDYYNSLSIAGVDGTLRRRLNGTFAENNFHGKTGTLNGVTSIAGYLTTKNNEDLVVSIIFEFTSGSWNFYRDVQDQIIELLTEIK